MVDEPFECAYSELNNPKHMKLPKVKLDDADGDGVTDQFDLDPNTPPVYPLIPMVFLKILMATACQTIEIKSYLLCKTAFRLMKTV
jgi:OOP family OmpA-OmpF porin